MTEHDPIVVAKAVATVDLVSGGRFLFGVGAGWNEEEMENHGTNPRRRWSVMRERVEAMKEMWTKEEAEYHGEHVDFDPIFSFPKPVQKPHPPVIVGGNGAKVRDRVIAFGDEWMPNRLGDEERFKSRIVKLQDQGREAGRDSVPVTLALAPTDPGRDRELRRDRRAPLPLLGASRRARRRRARARQVHAAGREARREVDRGRPASRIAEA